MYGRYQLKARPQEIISPKTDLHELKTQENLTRATDKQKKALTSVPGQEVSKTLSVEVEHELVPKPQQTEEDILKKK